MIKHLSLKYIPLLFLLLYNTLFGQYIQVDTSLTKEKLVEKFIGTNTGCITVSDVNISGYDRNRSEISYGYFSKGSSNFELADGIILSTGKAKDAEGPKGFLQDFYGSNWLGDNDLINILRESDLPYDNILNATYLEFDFISNQTEQISFEYMFLSEEYQANNCNYSDAFAFLIKKADNSEPYKNIALIPGTNTPVTSLTINGADRCKSHENFFGGFNTYYSPTNFNGQTKVLKAFANIEAGVKYHIKLVIADHGDARGRYDSAVFLKAGSFVATKSLGDDILLCPESTEVIDASNPDSTYKWYKDGREIIGETDEKLVVKEAGLYEVDIIQKNGCILKGFINVFEQEKINIYEDYFELCDNDLDGVINVELKNYTGLIIDDYLPGAEVKYFETLEDAQNNAGNEISNISFNSSINSKTVYIRIKAGSCPPVITPITFKNNELSQYNNVIKDICNTSFEPEIDIVLSDYLSEIASSIEGSPTYYLTETDAKTKQNAISQNQKLNSNKTFYIRFKQTNFCENVAPIHFIYKEAKRSDTLKDVTICKDSFTTLDAGSGFDSYLWDFNNATTSSIKNVPVGVYHVRLETNGCFYTQEVKVIAAEDPIIQTIEIQGSTVTVNVTGSDSPYSYSLDNGPFQVSNVFTNVTLGQHTVRVKSNLNCTPVSRDFSLIKLINFFSPNGDGKNDLLDYSQLRNKKNPIFIIYDRAGKLVFNGSEANNFTWDGKVNGLSLPSDSYWYTIEWTEENSTQNQKFTGWILLKRK